MPLYRSKFVKLLTTLPFMLNLCGCLMSYHSFGKFPNISDPGSIMFMDLSMISCLDLIVVMLIISCL